MKCFFVKHCIYYILGLLIFAAITIAVISGINKEHQNASVINGILDLQGIDLEQTGPIKLDGVWEYYWNQLLSSEDFSGKTDIKQEFTGYMQVPGLWTKELNGKKIPSRGYATYRLRIKLNDMKTVLGIKTTNIRFDSRIFVNGTVLMENGRFAVDSKNPLPSNTPQVGYFYVDGNEVEIIVQDINVDNEYGGILQSIYIGDQVDISRKKFILETVDLIVFSSLMIISFI